MSIRVVCPNGHPLKVPDDFAGKSGLCPVCKARVKVPRPAHIQVSEEAILDFLGPQQTVAVEESPAPPTPVPGVLPKAQYEGPLPPKKSCERCNREIPANIHVCPFCHTYIAGLAEV